MTGGSGCDAGTPRVEFLTKLPLVARFQLKSRARLEAENLVLRQQVIVLNRNSRSRVWLRNVDRLTLVWLYQLVPSILEAITVVKPETVIRRHRRGFRVYWHWNSCRRGGRPRIDREIRVLIRRMSEENPLWGAPRIHDESLRLEIEVAESAVADPFVATHANKTSARQKLCAVADGNLVRCPGLWQVVEGDATFPVRPASQAVRQRFSRWPAAR